MNDPVYILIRTSNRPKYFACMMKSIKDQTYDNIITIVHTDDPRDEYVTGDIIIKGSAYGFEYGNGTYNLYNNRLLKAIPEGSGWYCFIDDDDEYAAPDVIERLVKNSKRDYINVGKVQRWNNTLWPKNWGSQKSYQTECFFLHTDHKLKATWWGNKGGDHHYTKQLTKILSINWIDNLLICKAQEGKGHGRKLDKGSNFVKRPDLPADANVAVLGLRKNMTGKRTEWLRQGQIKYMPYASAVRLENLGKAKITNYMINTDKPPVRNLLQG